MQKNEKNTTAESSGARYSINPSFEKEYDAWDKKKTGFAFRIGTTSQMLQKLGVDNKKIWWDSSKIKTIRQKHSAMSDNVIKQVPNILENPILVMESKTRANCLTLFGEVYDDNGSPVLAVLLLNPTSKNGKSLDILKVASAYGKNANPQSFINQSNLLYVDPDKTRTHNWLSVNRLQLPLPSSNYGFLNTIKPQKASGVNTQSMQNNARKSLNVEFDENTDFSENMKKVANMKSVCDLTGHEFAKGDTDLITQVTEYFTTIGNKVDSKYGSVVINRTDVKSSVSHGIGRKKAIAFKAVPSVIENGEIINYKSNYKNRNYDTVVFAAPITIARTSYFAAIVVTVNKSSNEYYLHEVAIQKKEDAVPFKTGNSKNATPSDTTSSIYSLLNSLQNVKKSSENNEIRLSKTVEPAKYTYEYFANKPAMQVTEIDDSKVYAANRQTRKEIIERSVENAKKVGRVNAQGNAVIHVDDIDTDVVVSKNGIKHGLDRRLNQMAQVTMNIGNILQNSIRINETLPSKKDASGSYILIGTANNKNGDLFIVESVVNSYTNELNSVNILYSINTKKEVAGLIDPELTEITAIRTTSTISISELLDYVNKYYPDILPKDVFERYGHKSRPEGMLGKSALYSRAVDVTEYSSLLKENKQLKQMNSILQQELKPGHHISNSQALKLAHWLKKQRNSKMDAAKLGLQLRNLFDYIGNDENVTMDTVMEMATNIAKSVIDESQTKVQMDDYAQTVLQDIRQYKIKLSDAQKAEARHQYGNLHEFNRHLMGRVRVGEDGMSLDQAWQELQQSRIKIYTQNTKRFLVIILLNLLMTFSR